MAAGGHVRNCFQKFLWIRHGGLGSGASPRLTCLALLMALIGGCQGGEGVNWTLYHDQLATWNEAKQYCLDIGQSLVVIDSEEKQTAFATTVREWSQRTTEDIWLGIYLSTPGLPNISAATCPSRNLTYTNWDTPVGEPNGLTTDLCIRMVSSSQLWRTMTCSNRYTFACEARTDSCWFEIYEDKSFQDPVPIKFPATSLQECKDICLNCQQDTDVCTALSYMETPGECSLLTGDSLYIGSSELPPMTAKTGSAVHVKRCYRGLEGAVEVGRLTWDNTTVPNTTCASSALGSGSAIATSSLPATGTSCWPSMTSLTTGADQPSLSVSGRDMETPSFPVAESPSPSVAASPVWSEGWWETSDSVVSTWTLTPSWNDFPSASLSATFEPTPMTDFGDRVSSSLWITESVMSSENHRTPEVSSISKGTTSSVSEQSAATCGVSTDVPSAPKPACACRCQLKTLVTMDMAEEAAERHRKLLVDKARLSSSRRKLTSAPDNRTSAVVIGRFGIALLITIGILLILPDAVHLIVFVWKRTGGREV